MWLQLDPLNPLNHEDHPVPRSSALFFRGHHRAPYGPVGEQQPGGALSLGTCWNMLEHVGTCWKGGAVEPRGDSWVTQIFSVSDVSDVSVSWIVVTSSD